MVAPYFAPHAFRRACSAAEGGRRRLVIFEGIEAPPPFGEVAEKATAGAYTLTRRLSLDAEVVVRAYRRVAQSHERRQSVVLRPRNPGRVVDSRLAIRLLDLCCGEGLARDRTLHIPHRENGRNRVRVNPGGRECCGRGGRVDLAGLVRRVDRVPELCLCLRDVRISPRRPARCVVLGYG